MNMVTPLIPGKDWHPKSASTKASRKARKLERQNRKKGRK